MATRKPILTPKAREEALRLLQEHYAENHLELPDFEERIEQVERATSIAEVEDALGGLPPLPVRGEVRGEGRGEVALAPRVRPVPAEGPRESLVAVLSNTGRVGAWRPPPLVRVVTVLGNAVVDLSEAELEGVVEVRVRSVLGAVKVIVPAGVRVECRGLAVMGSFPVFDQAARGGRVVRIVGYAVLGSVEVEVRERRGLLDNLKDNLRGLLKP